MTRSLRHPRNTVVRQRWRIPTLLHLLEFALVNSTYVGVNMWLEPMQVRHFRAVDLLISSVIASIIISHSMRSLNTEISINAPSNNGISMWIWKRNLPPIWEVSLSESAKVRQWGQDLCSAPVILFLRFTSLESRCWIEQECAVCLSCFTQHSESVRRIKE